LPPTIDPRANLTCQQMRDLTNQGYDMSGHNMTGLDMCMRMVQTPLWASLLFLGEFEHSIDDKSRLAVPARFRPALE